MKKLLFVSLLFLATGGFAQWPATWWPFVGLTQPYSPGELWVDPQSNYLYVGGEFDYMDNVAGYDVVRYDGTNWSSMGAGFGGVPHSYVSCFESYGGNIIAAGNFFSSGNMTVNNIARWVGGAWWPLPGGGTNGPVNALCVYNGELYVGGGFTYAGNVQSNFLAKWNGSVWTALTIPDYVNAMCIYNGTLYVASGGDIYKENGNVFTSIGSMLFNMSTGVAVGMKVYNNELYACGGFDMIASTACNGLARYNGSTWNDAGAILFPMNNAGGIHDMEINGNRLYITGYFDTINGNQFANGFAMWDGNSWSTLGTGPYDGYSIKMFKGDVYASMREGVMKLDSTLSSVNDVAEKLNVNVFPNPSSSTIHISLPQKNKVSTVNILDLSGKQVASYLPGSDYDISFLEDGTYLLEAITEKNERFFGKIIKL
jgi:hypothetical protein